MLRGIQMLNNLVESISKKISEGINNNNRVIKLCVSPAFDKITSNAIYNLKVKYEFYNLEDISSMPQRTKELSIVKDFFYKTAVFILGIVPVLGTAFGTCFFLVEISKDIYDYSVSTKEMNFLLGKSIIRKKSHQKYLKAKRIIYVKNYMDLSEKEKGFINFINYLITKKYLRSTILIILTYEDDCQNVENSFSIDFLLTKQLLKKMLPESESIGIDTIFVRLLNFIGIEYVEEISNLYVNSLQITRLETILERIFSSTGIDVNNHSIKLFSLLFDKFSLSDAEYSYKLISDVDDSLEIVLSDLLEAAILYPPEYNYYSFIKESLRDFYRYNDCIVLESSIYNQVYQYVLKTHPSNFSDIALLSEINSLYLTKKEIISNLVIAYYHDGYTESARKIGRIEESLLSEEVGSDLVKLNRWNNEIDSCNKDEVLSLCSELVQEIDLSPLTNQAKLCFMNYISTLVYEFNDNDVLNEKVLTLYFKLISKENLDDLSSLKMDLIADIIIFSTCINDRRNFQNRIERLLLLYQTKFQNMHKSEKSIRLLRLGNAIYISNINEGLKLTRQAYLMSKDFLYEHMLARINYSYSLCMLGKYKESTKLFSTISGEERVNNYTYYSAVNNHVVSKFLGTNSMRKSDKKRMYSEFKRLYSEVKDDKSSDSFIIRNNYILACVINNNYNSDFKNACSLLNNCQDTYHQFFYRNALIVKAYQEFDASSFESHLSNISVPYLLNHYEDFIVEKLKIIESSFRNEENIDLLQTKIEKMKSKRYNEEQYSHVSNIYLFGLLERWFE